MVLLPKVTLKGAGRGNTDVGGIIIPTEQFEVLDDAWHLLRTETPPPSSSPVPQGPPRRCSSEAFAAYLGVPYLKVDAGAVRTADDWAGAFRQDPNTKTWAHRWSPLALALRRASRASSTSTNSPGPRRPAALNAFMGLLDETGTLLVPDANAVLQMPKGILVVATANIGPEFVGTLPLDGAVRQRFPYGFRMASARSCRVETAGQADRRHRRRRRGPGSDGHRAAQAPRRCSAVPVRGHHLHSHPA